MPKTSNSSQASKQLPNVPKLKYLSGAINSDALVVGLASKEKNLEIVSGELKLDEKEILQSLKDLGATGKADEVIKLPGSATKVLLFTGLGKAQRNYPSEVIRRAAGIAAQSLAGHKSATFSINGDTRAIAEGEMPDDIVCLLKAGSQRHPVRLIKLQ